MIDADTLDEAIRTDFWEHFTQCHDTDQTALIDMVCEDIGNAPTVDAIEVIRCRDCKYSEPCKPHKKIWCPRIGRYLNADFYCAEGAKKDG